MLPNIILFFSFQLIGIVIAFYLCANVRDVDDEDEFDYEVEV
jgi:hypothetical protein